MFEKTLITKIPDKTKTSRLLPSDLKWLLAILIDNCTLRANSVHAQASQTLHRLGGKSVETATSSSNQQLISRKYLPKEITVQLES